MARNECRRRQTRDDELASVIGHHPDGDDEGYRHPPALPQRVPGSERVGEGVGDGVGECVREGGTDGGRE